MGRRGPFSNGHAIHRNTRVAEISPTAAAAVVAGAALDSVGAERRAKAGRPRPRLAGAACLDEKEKRKTPRFREKMN
jgi:hypothetical protein